MTVFTEYFNVLMLLIEGRCGCSCYQLAKLSYVNISENERHIGT